MAEQAERSAESSMNTIPTYDEMPEDNAQLAKMAVEANSA